MRGHARGYDDEVGARLDDRVHEGGRVLLSVDINIGDVVEEERLPAARVKRSYLPGAGKQCSRRALTGLAPTDNSSETTHRRDTHSA